MPLSKETQERIEQESYRVYPGSGYDDRICREAYIEGMTAEVERMRIELEKWEKLAKVGTPEKWLEMYQHYQELL